MFGKAALKMAAFDRSSSGATPSVRVARIREVPPTFLVLSVCFGFAAGCGGPGSEQARTDRDGDTIVAKVGDEKVYGQALSRELARRGVFAGKDTESPARDAAIDSLVRRELLALAAVDSGIDEEPDIARTYKEMLGQRYWQRQLESHSAELSVGEDEIERHYASNPDLYRSTRRARGAAVIVRTALSATDEERATARAQAEKALEAALRLDADEMFLGEAAREHSSDKASALRDGDVGWLVEDVKIYSLEPAAVTALFALERPGSISPVIEGERGFYVMKLVEVAGGDVKELGVVRDDIQAQLHAEKSRVLQQRLIEDLEYRYGIDLYHDAIDVVLRERKQVIAGDGPPTFPLPQKGDGASADRRRSEG